MAGPDFRFLAEVLRRSVAKGGKGRLRTTKTEGDQQTSKTKAKEATISRLSFFFSVHLFSQLGTV